MLATANLVWVPPILQFTWEACVGSEFARKFVPVNVMLSVCDAEVMAGAGVGLTNMYGGAGIAGGAMTRAMGFERAAFSRPAAGAPMMAATHSRAGPTSTP